MKILITGATGYIGYPLIIELLNNTTFDIIGIDNNNRDHWVCKCGGNTFTPNFTKDDRLNLIYGDLTDKNFVYEILQIHKPDVVIHLASQPSMPYSDLNGERAIFSQTNNLVMLLNLLWGAKENGPSPKFIVTTTTGIPGQTNKINPEDHTPNLAGSWYHVSRGFDSANLNLASRQFGFEVVELRTSIVYGLQTTTLRRLGLSTRFDTDTYFGTALNRFIDQAMNGTPITVYGEGKQTKPFISLNDTVISIVNAINYKFAKKHTILNQTTIDISINDLAELVKLFTNCEVHHVLNPRKEKEDWNMTFENKKFLEVLGKEPDGITQGIKEIIGFLKTKV